MIKMPRVKIAYVVSFSSEDPENRAENLLSAEVSKKKWLCSHWEPSCSVLLQLERAVEISAIHVGAYNAALVEVLAGLSERPNDSFQVLVPSCVFQSPAEARRGAAPDRVRSFPRDALAPAAAARADRLRVVCSQPYNKHCKYGLSFVHVHSAEGPPPPRPSAVAAPSPRPSAAGAPSPRPSAADAPSSDEDEFRPGELFARRLRDAPGNTSTSAQIRQASAQALRNVPGSSTTLVKTTISSTGLDAQKLAGDVRADRRRDGLMYTDDDDRPHGKIDRVVNRHKKEKSKEDEQNKTKNIEKNKREEKKYRNTGDRADTEKRGSDGRCGKSNEEAPAAGAPAPPRGRTPSRHREQTTGTPGASGSPAEERDVLRGVELALSGYEGARRAALRDLALRLGAAYSARWTPRCTHLVCAFPNTPKLREARAASRSVAAATADWLEECAAQRRRLPWQWFATLPAERVPAEPLAAPPAAPTNKRDLSEEDTDDEIERHLGAKKRARNASPQPSAADSSGDSDVAFVRDERFRGHVSLHSDDDDDDDERTDGEAAAPRPERIDPGKALPDFFEGYTFVILDEVGDRRDIELLARYVRAYGGLVVQPSEAQREGEVDFVVGGAGRSPAWVWRCHRARRLLPADEHF